MANNTAATIINDILDQKRKRIGLYSLRAFARDLGLSPSFVSRALSGQKSFTLDHLKKIFKILDVDRETQIQLKNKILKEKLGADFKHLLKTYNTDTHLNFKKLNKKNLTILSEWYHTPVLETFTMGSFQDSPQNIAQRLNISVFQVEQSIKLLVRLKILKFENGIYSREQNKIRLSSSASQPEIRTYHRAMISKAYRQLEKTDDLSFDQRLITGITISANPDKLDEAKAILNDAIHRAAKVMETHPCTQVYQFNLQIFPLTKK